MHCNRSVTVRHSTTGSARHAAAIQRWRVAHPDPGPAGSAQRPEPSLAEGLARCLSAKRPATGSARAVILTGAGKAFCAGADIAEWAESEKAGTLESYGWTDESHALVAEVFEFPKPTVALLNGAAVGAGLDLALACDFRFAADTARFSCAYTKMAYPPDAGGSWLLPRLIGLAAAKRFVYTGEFWSAAEAKAAGMVSEIHPADTLERCSHGVRPAPGRGPDDCHRRSQNT